MRNKAAIFIILAFIIPMFWGCTGKIVEKKKEDLLVELITSDIWLLNSFYEGSNNLSAEFAPYQFKFNTDGAMFANKVGFPNATGNWVGNVTAMTIYTNFPMETGIFKKLNGLYTITSSSLIDVKANRLEGATEIKIHLIKIVLSPFDMPNSFFSFKQFTIHQHNCAMKVTTDSCLFGAWASLLSNGHKALDIGAGTGLLAVMYAQKNPLAVMDAVEIDADAATQAADNVAGSPWPSAIKIIHQNIIDFKPANLYDAIISNPPFYKQQLQSSDVKKNAAHHSSHLSLQDLFQNVARLLNNKGQFYVLLPWYRTDEALAIAAAFSLFPANITGVKQTPKHPYFRSMLLFTRLQKNHIQEQEIIIETEKGKYSEVFTALLKDYYLYL